MKFKLIDDVKGAWKLLSIRVAAIWAVVISFAAAFPDTMTLVWAQLPDEVKSLLPPWIRFGISLVTVLGTIYAARVIKQPVTKAGAVDAAVKATDIPKETLKTMTDEQLEAVTAANPVPPLKRDIIGMPRND